MRKLLPLLLLTACTEPADAAPREPLDQCRAVDGDTLNCAGERIRIIAIQAADNPTSAPCRRNAPNYTCDLALYQAGKDEMARIVAGGGLEIEREGVDRYGRVTGHVYDRAGRSVACTMMAGGWADYWREYDRGGRVAGECGL